MHRLVRSGFLYLFLPCFLILQSSTAIPATPTPSPSVKASTSPTPSPTVKASTSPTPSPTGKAKVVVDT